MAQARIGYAAMLEQFAPRDLVDWSVAAEAAGFDGIMAADHVQPWVPRQGNAAFVWSYMTAAAEHTRGDIGPGVTCPSFRMHPAIVAQAAATMTAMYPGRFWLGLGSGEALNEHMVAPYWPEVSERISRMFEAIEIIQKLFTGKDVKHRGEFFRSGDGAPVDHAADAAADLRGDCRARDRGAHRPAVRRHHHGGCR